MLSGLVHKPSKTAVFAIIIAIANYLAGTEQTAAQTPAGENEGLWAAAKNPAAPAELDAFGQFVGDWDMTWRATPRNSPERSGKAEWHFRWALDGMAVQDVWIAPTRKARADGSSPVGWGTGIRTFNPARGIYEVVWISSDSGEMILFEGEATGDKIVMRGKGDDGRELRWAFDQITPNSFHWYEDSSFNGGKTFVRTFDMLGQRICTVGSCR